MFEKILATLFNSIISSITAWFKAEQAAADKSAAEARAKQIESIKKGKAFEKALEGSIVEAKKKQITIAGWNSGLILLFLCLPLFSGCFFRHYVTAPMYKAVPPEIARPTISTEPELTERENTIMSYALQLEAAYKMIREEAIKYNEENELTIP